jgi:hypothetical protein
MQFVYKRYWLGFCRGVFWVGIPGVAAGIGRNGSLNIGVGKSWEC